MCDEKRKRSPNWLPSEKHLLLDLVEEHFSVVENKKTDSVSTKKKLAEWLIISQKYNSQTTHCSRSADNLKSQWESMKKAARKEESSNRLHRIQTGGEPPSKKKEDPVHSQIIRLLKASSIGLVNPFDGDSVVPEHSDTTADSIVHNEVPVPIKLELNIETDTNKYEVNKDCGDYTSHSLRDPLSTPLRINIEGRGPGTTQSKTKSWFSNTNSLAASPWSSCIRRKWKLYFSRGRWQLNRQAERKKSMLWMWK